GWLRGATVRAYVCTDPCATSGAPARHDREGVRAAPAAISSTGAEQDRRLRCRDRAGRSEPGLVWPGVVALFLCSLRRCGCAAALPDGRASQRAVLAKRRL